MPRVDSEGNRGFAIPFPLEEGVGYLVRGKSADATFRLAEYHAEQGVPVLGVSCIYPDRLRSRYGLANAILCWISESPGEGQFDLTAVSTLSSALEKFIEAHADGSLTVLDGIEFISMNIGFTKSLRFIEHLNEYVVPRRATCL